MVCYRSCSLVALCAPRSKVTDWHGAPHPKYDFDQLLHSDLKVHPWMNAALEEVSSFGQPDDVEMATL